MSLSGAAVTRMCACIGLHAAHPDRLEVTTDFGVQVRAPSGHDFKYASGMGIADVPPRAGPLENFFGRFARDNFEDLLTGMRNDGYDGAKPLDVHLIDWQIGDDVRDAQLRLDSA